MRKIFIFIFAFLTSLSLMAQQPTALGDLVIKMNTAQRDGDYLGALSAASAILKINNNHRVAKEFVHDNYQRMELQAKDRISEISFSEDAADLEEICYIYCKLSEINENLSEVEMPLQGGNKLVGEWVWQPEIQYYRGHYDRARTKVLQMYRSIGIAALKENNPDAALVYFQKGLNTYLMSEEYPSQLKNLVNQCIEAATIDSRSHQTDQLLRAYNTYGVVEKLDTTISMKDERDNLRLLIADNYVRDAEKLLASDLPSDWEQAIDIYRTALEWNKEPKFQKNIASQMEAARKQIATNNQGQDLSPQQEETDF